MPWSYRVLVVAADVPSGSTWREGHHGDIDNDRGGVDIVVDDKELLRSEINTR